MKKSDWHKSHGYTIVDFDGFNVFDNREERKRERNAKQGLTFSSGFMGKCFDTIEEAIAQIDDFIFKETGEKYDLLDTKDSIYEKITKLLANMIDSVPRTKLDKKVKSKAKKLGIPEHLYSKDEPEIRLIKNPDGEYGLALFKVDMDALGEVTETRVSQILVHEKIVNYYEDILLGKRPLE